MDETESIQRLRAIRGGHRGVATKLVKEADEVLKSTTPLTNDATTKLNTLRQQIAGKLSKLNEVDEKILAICDVRDIENEIAESEEVIARVTACMVGLESAINCVTSPPQAQAQHPSSSIGSTNIDYSNSIRTRLPKLTLPKFKGDVTKWSTFWDSFKSAVHGNSGISAIDKFNYLNSLLEGPAARAIQGLTLTESNYNSAVELLEQRFGKPQQIIAAHMDELLKIPSCNGERPTSLRYVYDKISVHVRGLATLGISSEQYGSLLIPIIMSKMSSEMRLRIAREAKGEVWKIDELLCVVKTEVEAREASDGARVTKDKVFDERKTRIGSPSTSSALVSNEMQGQGGFKIQCAFCNAPHYSASCEKVVSSSERKAILKKAGRCFRCLYKGHQLRECKGPRNCRNCNGQHHQSICALRENKGQDHAQQHVVKTDIREPTAETTTVTSASDKNKRHVLLQTARATAVNEDGSKSTSVRVLFDNGSQRSYITDNLKSRLCLKPSKSEVLHLNTFGDNKYKKQSCQVLTLNLKTRSDVSIPISVLNFPVICSPLGSKVDVRDYSHLHDLELADYAIDDQRESIDVLIGSDHYWDFITGETVRGERGPTAVQSKLGWLLSGPINTSINESQVVSNLILSGGNNFDHFNESQDEVIEVLKRFWEVEAIGICDEPPDESTPLTTAELCKDVSFNGQRYEVGLPWKRGSLPISDNYHSCCNRLRSLHHKLRKEPKLLVEYDNIIQEQLKNGIVERVPVPNAEIDTANSVGIRYSPHHPVVRQDKDTTKVRIVYDGSAKASKEEHSLNDCLETGPNFIPHIFDTLVKFRWNQVGLTADIEKAFLMVGIKDEDKNMLRFLWFDKPQASNPNIIALRFNRLIFGLRPSPSILGSTIQHHLRLYKKSDPKMAELLSNSFYVDDLLTGEENVSKSFGIYERSKRIMTEGGFNLRKWNSNSQELLRRIEQAESKTTSEERCTKPEVTVEDDESYAKSTTDQTSSTPSNTVKTLGVHWNTNSDTIFFNFTEWQDYAKSLPITKRSLLMLVARIFDPLGLLSPFTITQKVLFQVLCVDKVDWDQELDGDLRSKFLAIQQEIGDLNSVQVPRYYFASDSTPTSVELHGFSDASQRAYAAVVYLRSTYDDGRIQVRLVSSKSRVAPTKRQSIPRLELLGAVILARLTSKIKSIIGEIDTTHWVDSMATLCWIKNNRPWKQYVRNRVAEVRTLTDEHSWRFCPGSKNPADLPSRGLVAKELASSDTWWNGPNFLYNAHSSWPSDESTQGDSVNDEALQEVIKQPPVITHSLVSKESSHPEVDISKLIDNRRFSSLTKLLRVTAYVVRFMDKLRRQAKGKIESTPTMELGVKEINDAEQLWIKSIQVASFPAEQKLLTSKETPQNSSKNYITQFGLFLDEKGIIRCKGRINNAVLPTNCKNPVFLPSKHHFVDLLISHTHVSVKHSGIRDTLTTLRERFWILRGRESVKKVLRRCVICRKHEGVSYKPQPSPDLPDVRVSDDPPFTHIGLDFAGPLYALNRRVREKEHDTDEANCLQKTYVLLFTCASTRAVHLELTTGVSVQAFLLAFRRFAGRRGLPATIMSDNAKTFKSADKELRKITRSEAVWRSLVEKRITWKFIVERAPWWGGFWERLVRSIKRPLKKVIGRSTLTIDELRTVLVEIEAIINARPITYVYDDDESISYPLTPSDLIYGRRITTAPNSSHHEVISTSQTLTRRVRHHRTLIRQITSQWRREYLTSLREHSTTRAKGTTNNGIKKGDIVIVKNDSTSRAYWKLARVEEVLAGADGKVRAATVKIGNENGRVLTTRRAIQHLVPIEVKPESPMVDDAKPADVPKANDTLQSPITQTESQRPRRTAAVMGELSRRLKNDI